MMKKIVCEMCGSTDLMKKDGVYECLNCGTKYSVEEAKKMMIEGKVDVSGSKVKVDNSDKIDNYLMMAQNAYNTKNFKETENYCNKIIENEPNNYKAWLLKGKAAGWQSTLAKLRLEESVNAFNKALDNAPKSEEKKLKKEVGGEIEDLTTALMQLCCNNFAEFPSKQNENSIRENVLIAQIHSIVLLDRCGLNLKDFKKNVANEINIACVSAWKNHIIKDYNEDPHPSKYVFERFIEQCFSCIDLTQIAIDLSEDDDEEDITRYKNLITYTESAIKSCSYKYSVSSYGGGYVTDYSLTNEAKEKNIDNIMKYHQKIKELDPEYEIPERPNINQTTGGCYVATCVYGSYDCPEVWTLRRFRDYTLAKTWYGRLFIRTYYAISPTIVKYFGKTSWFQTIWKRRLDKLVRKLQEEGIENTPYEDKNWK